ncbi:MAG: Cys-tRNA(Pro) deacylase [Agathobaculum sp.]|jgi:Cys-tRNA(Pro)/Cys-tRNA(Cys) deacylase|uniref:Cys-tRNA(Pro) deacylase n=1 Tax=Agathobaculum sp. TaxID=2048138 RepID=UPI003D94F197
MPSDKTNVMRILEQHKIPYTPHAYPHGKDAVDGVSVAHLLGQAEEQVFKTLVARGRSGSLHVFVIPVAKELDLKKAAKAAGEKSVELVHVKELLGLTGYVRGGCSPIGMKKAFPTVFDESASVQPTIMVSAGKIGFQVECAPQALISLTRAATAPLTTD